MAKTTRQTAIFGVQDWKRIYNTYREADLQSYDFETLRKGFIDYLRLYYPETFNDYTESSEFIAILDVIAFMGQSLAFRNDLNSRENFIDTAERRDSVVKLANLVGYTPRRNTNSSGYLKVLAVSTTETIVDFNRRNLSSVKIIWNDVTNQDWFEQFTIVMNAAMIDNQRFGQPGNGQEILGIQTDEYKLRSQAGYLPIVPFTSTVDGVRMPFEVVSATSLGKNYIYEPAPRADDEINVLYRNDKLGYGAANTGFFFHFKQGTLTNQDFVIEERIANRTVSLNVDGVNNDDVWLFELSQQASIVSEWSKVENLYAVGASPVVDGKLREVYAISSRVSDQITLTFGDGIFSEIPVGQYRAYVRSSNGLQYVINPNEMQNISIPIPYIGRTGRNETITFTLGLQTPVINSQVRESLEDIKTRAPSKFYSQNRMVNGEDYNNFPYTQFTSILKSKAITRACVGINRSLDLLDPTGKYSSTNAYASDGVFYRKYTDSSFAFTFANLGDVSNMLTSQLLPAIKSRAMTHFYHDKFPRFSYAADSYTWHQSTVQSNQSTGYIKNASGNPAAVGEFASGNLKFVNVNALIKFSSPSGYYFNSNNKLVAGSPTGPNEKLEIWSTVTSLTLDGTNFGNGELDDGLGPVKLNNFVPLGAILDEVIPRFITDVTDSVIDSMIDQIELNRNFAIGFDNQLGTWYLINSDNLDQNADFSRSYANDTAMLQQDASWLAQFIFANQAYTVKYRVLNYYFASVIENRFIYDDSTAIFDPRTGKTVDDFVTVLKINSKPDSATALPSDIKLDIIGQEVESDGFVDNFKVIVSYADADSDGIADNPDIFTDIVAPLVSADTKKVFFQEILDSANLKRHVPLASSVIEIDYSTLDQINLAKTEFVNGQVFYAITPDKFYKLAVVGTTYTISESTEYIVSTGRSDLHFHYKHNSANTRRIDPAVTNIIDLYLVTSGYYDSYQNYIKDITGVVVEPIAPTVDELSMAYSTLQDYKMVSDNLILNPVKFKPLFGSKAAEGLQGKIKVIKHSNTIASLGEIKSRVVSVINSYFTIDKWDFGDTFYFSELGAYIHDQLGDIINSVVLVPADLSKSFGDLYEIRSAPNEIFVNAATVTDIEVVDALTSSVLRTATDSGIT